MILDLGLIDYQESYRIQKEFVRRRKLGEISDSFIILEHTPVFTIGRAGRRENLLVDEGILTNEGISLHRVDRGGDITFHGPGQLVVYPIIDLRHRKKDLHKYLWDLEEVVMNFLEKYSLYGARLKGRTGVWLGNEKVAFIGVAATDWVTYHGLSVNIDVDLRYFSMIRPCGLNDLRVTSLSKILNIEIAMSDAKKIFASCLGGIFDLKDAHLERDFSILAQEAAGN